MDEQLRPVVQGEAYRVAAVLNDRAHGGVGGGHYHIAGGLDAHPLPQDTLGEHLVGDLLHGDDPAGQGGGDALRPSGGGLRLGLFFCLGDDGGGRGLRGGRTQPPVGGGQLPAAHQDGQDKGHRDGCQHGDEEVQPELGLDGQNPGQAAHTDGVGLHAGADGDDRPAGGADHAAHQGEPVFQVDAEEGGLGDPQVTGDAGGDVHLLGPLILLLEHAHSQHSGALGDVGQGDHGPQIGAAVQVHQLGVNGVGHVVQAGHNDGGVQQAEEGRKQPAHIGGEAGIHHRGDGVADLPSDGTHDGVGHQDRRHQGAEGHHDHAHHFGADLFKELLQVHQHKAGQHGGDDLALIADHLDLDKAEVPHGDVLHGGGGHREAVEQLGGHQGQPQDDA